MLKKIKIVLISVMVTFGVICNINAEEFYEEGFISEQDSDMADEISSDALNNYNTEGSLFEKIVNLEQEKIVMQLEKERAQLDLELERLNAEKIKLQMELDTLSGREEQQQQELEAAKAQLEIQTEKLKRQMDSLDSQESTKTERAPEKRQEENIAKKYKLINVVGVDNQLQATISEVSSGQNKRISVGKELDGYIVKSISLNEGIVFEKDGETESLNIGK